MEELIKRLRTFTENISNDDFDILVTPDVCIEAADAIEQLQAELAALRQQIAEAEPVGFVAVDRHSFKSNDQLVGGEILAMDEADDFYPECVKRVFATPQPCPKCAKALDALNSFIEATAGNFDGLILTYRCIVKHAIAELEK